ncbi:MAG: restriction endonuclease subunit S [Bacteroidales bacterium]|nr:restriction endonuclease subunit S [Bacteroidales bacterium]
MKQRWEIKTIADVCTFIKNGANIKQERGAGGVPITRIETLSGGVFNRDRLGYANLATPDKYLSYVLEYGDLLFSHINSKTYIGRTVVYVPENDEQVIHGMNLLRLKLDFDLMSPFFFQYYTRTDIFKAQVANRRKDAVNQSSITTTDIKTISLPVPPIAEQEKIVAELDCLSGIIEKKKQQLKELDALAQSIFYEMFGDPVENDKGWDMKKLGDITNDIFAGGDKPDDISPIKDEDYRYPIYANGDGERGLLGYSKTYRVKSKALTVGARGASIGNCRICDGEFTPVVRLITIVPSDKVDVVFLFHYVRQIEFNINGAGQAQLTTPNVKNKEVFVPPITLQQEFASKIEAIEKQKELIAQSIKETETLFNSRMDYYFN